MNSTEVVGGMNVFISLSDKKIEHVDMFGIYGDDLLLFEDEEEDKRILNFLNKLLIHYKIFSGIRQHLLF